LTILARNFDVAKVQCENDLKAVGAFRYRCYLADGLIESRDDEIFTDQYDATDASHIFMVLSSGQIVSTIRLHLLTEACHRSATMATFADILMPKIRSGMIISDAARLAVDPHIGRLRLLAARRTLRIYEDFVAENAVEFGVASVLESRIDMYNRIYGFRQISEPRPYGDLKKNLVLMGVDLRNGQYKGFNRI